MWGDGSRECGERQRWGGFYFRFDPPAQSDADRIRNLHSGLARLKELILAILALLARLVTVTVVGSWLRLMDTLRRERRSFPDAAGGGRQGTWTR